jgi:hypothetical protein
MKADGCRELTFAIMDHIEAERTTAAATNVDATMTPAR